MNKVSCTIRLAAGPMPQVDAVVLACSCETYLFDRMLAEKPDTKNPGGERLELARDCQVIRESANTERDL